MAEPPAGLFSEHDPPDPDLYCLKCGYNLRGLSGDPRRCPECGHWNPLGDLELPAELISQQLRRTETAPAVCVGAVLMVLMGACTIVLPICFTRFRILELLRTCGGSALPVGVMLWVLSAVRFKHSCLARPGWRLALWWYHLYAVSLALVVMLSIFMVTFGPDLFTGRTREMLGPLRVGWMLLMLVAGRFGGPWVHSRLQHILHPLQREVAVRLARQRLRERLRRGHD